MINKTWLLSLPEKPGVYMMYDSFGNIIYIGKAKNLKRRVSQYFSSSSVRDPKVAEMIEHIAEIQYTLNDTELEALLEECRLIKKYKPMYNRLMKNDLRRCYILITEGPYPKVALAMEQGKKDGCYYGPFFNLHRTEMAVKYLEEFYPIRKCNSPVPAAKKSGCLYYQLGSCLGACTGKASPDEYRHYLDKINLLLKGKRKFELKELAEKLHAAAEKLEFEKAARYREYLSGLKYVIGKRQLIRLSDRQKMIIAVEFFANKLAKLFFIRGNILLEAQTICLAFEEKSFLADKLKCLIKESFGCGEGKEGKNEKSGKNGKNGGDTLKPDQIDQAQIIHSYLHQRQKSQKNKNLHKRKNHFFCCRLASSTLSHDRDLDQVVQGIVDQMTAYCSGQSECTPSANPYRSVHA